MSKINPWQVEGNPWLTEAKFITWIRGVLRKGWNVHPLKLEYLKRFRTRIKNPNPKGRVPEVWGMTCEVCHKDTIQTQIEIDHKGDQGKFTTMSEIEGYARHLFMITYDDIRAVCKPCHKIISLSQRRDISFEDAVIQKAIIEKCKLKTKVQLALLSGYGYNDCGNTTKRKAAWTEIITKEMHIE